MRRSPASRSKVRNRVVALTLLGFILPISACAKTGPIPQSMIFAAPPATDLRSSPNVIVNVLLWSIVQVVVNESDQPLTVSGAVLDPGGMLFQNNPSGVGVKGSGTFGGKNASENLSEMHLTFTAPNGAFVAVNSTVEPDYSHGQIQGTGLGFSEPEILAGAFNPEYRITIVSCSAQCLTSY